MRYRSRRGQPAPEPLWRRLDRVAREVNPFLMLLAIGLVVLYVTCLGDLLLKLPIIHANTCAVGPLPATENLAQDPFSNAKAITSGP